MPQRKIVSPAELNAWLTSEIRKVDGCHECGLTWKYRLRDPEEHGGCNWSQLTLRLGADIDIRVATKAAAEIEVRASELFNLEDEPAPVPHLPAKEFHVDMERRRLYTPVFHLDANLINARQKCEAVNRLEKWRDDEVILLAMSGIAHIEAQAGAGAEARKKKAATHIFTINEAGDAIEDDTAAQVEEILFGKASDDNQANDIAVVCEAIKFNAILVTNDGDSKTQPGGMLGNREKLREKFGVEIYRPGEAVDFIRNEIAKRDQFNMQVAALTGNPVPAWTGQD